MMRIAMILVGSIAFGCGGGADGGDDDDGGADGAQTDAEGTATSGTSTSSGPTDDGAMVCVPGEVRECDCPGGGAGSQVCVVDGSGFYPCFCGATEATGLDPSSGEGSMGGTDTTGEGTSSGGPIGSVPTVGIQHPADGDNSRTVGVAIPFDGSAIDVEDGMLVGDALVWTSDVDGELGTGANIMAPLATEGDHVITLSATDSDGNVGTSSISMYLQPP